MTAPPFALLASGRSLRTDFLPVGADKFMLSLEDPGHVSELAVFVLPGVAIPEDRGVIIFAGTPESGFATIGALSGRAPSTIIHTGWPSLPDVAKLPVIQIGLSLEPAQNVLAAQQSLSSGESDKLGFAQLIAKDLLLFVQSFAHITPTGEHIILPPDALNRWYTKFATKFRSDPNFLSRATL